MNWILARLRVFRDWLTRVEPTYQTVVNPDKDRSLSGKARRKARRA